MRRWSSLLLAVLLSLAFSLVGCAKECRTDADCVAPGACTAARCLDSGKCQFLTESPCCGNGACEEEAGENACTCNADCSFAATDDGSCSGKVLLPDPRREDRTVAAERAEYYCDGGSCVVGVPPAKVQSKQLLSEHPGVVRFEVVTSVSQPFVLGKGSCEVRVKLVDMDESRAQGPVRITNLQVLSRNELIGERPLDVIFLNVTDEAVVEVSLVPTMAELEEERFFNVKIDYSYQGLGVSGFSLVRDSLETAQASLPFIDPDQVVLP
ncbi:hypothetical protein JXA12_05085 [Candidatus Woesearchaeota archaeon]|nr:hypothetical protein [Candidatus Woesearchaeota archaeon]